MAHWKALIDFLLTVIEFLFLSLTLRRYKENVSKLTAFGGVGQFEPRFHGEGVVPRAYFLVSTKLDTFCYLTAQTASCDVPSF